MRGTFALRHGKGPADKQLRDCWVEFLSRWPWELFATLTFQNPIHPESADRRFRGWVGSANRQRLGRRWSKKPDAITWVRFSELQRRGVLHYHTLMRHVGGLDGQTLRRRWHSRNGLAKIEPIRDQTRVLRYVTKCSQEADAVDVGGPWDADQLSLLPFAAPQ